MSKIAEGALDFVPGGKAVRLGVKAAKLASAANKTSKVVRTAKKASTASKAARARRAAQAAKTKKRVKMVKKCVKKAKRAYKRATKNLRKCPKGHFMVKTRGKIPAYNGLDTRCDTCGTGKLSTKNYYYHCGICKYDKCASCSTDCPGHHGLTGFYTPGDGFGCDACGEILAQDSVMFGCRKCNYDLCANCVMNDCPKGCGLTEFQTPHPRYSCDGCYKRTGVKKQLPTGTTMYGCRPCNYDLCEDCIFPQ